MLNILALPLTVLLLPLAGALVKLRAAYTPKSPPALEDDEPQRGRSSPSPIVQAFVQTWKVEGWQVLFKGIVPTVVIGLLLFARLPLQILISPAHAHIWSFWDLPLSFLINMILLPVQVWLYRTIATPAKLRVFSTPALDALHILFSPYEIKRFLLPIFLTPGLAVAIFLDIAFRVHIRPPLQGLLEPSIWPYHYRGSAFSIHAVPAVFLVTIICAPLDVVIVRLCLQKNLERPPIVGWVLATWKSLNIFNKALIVAVTVGDLAMFIWTLIDYNIRDELLMQTIPAGVTSIVALYIFYLTRNVGEWKQENEPCCKATEEKSVRLDTPEALDPLPSPATGAHSETVIELRGTDMPPYTGFSDCVAKIVKEEGYWALYRGSWLTFLVLYFLG